MEEAYRLLAAAMAFPVLFGFAWLAKNKKRGVLSMINLRFRRARCIKARLKTANGRTIESIVVPNSRGFIHVEDGWYRFDQEWADFDAKLRIPIFDIIEGQIQAPDKELGEITQELTVMVKDKKGKVQRETRHVPAYVVAHRKVMPKQLENLTAQEVHDFMDAKIVQDITTATAQTIKQMQIMFILVIATFAVVLIGDIILFNSINSLKKTLEAMIYAQTLGK
jgi:hypothetical protein